MFARSGRLDGIFAPSCRMRLGSRLNLSYVGIELGADHCFFLQTVSTECLTTNQMITGSPGKQDSASLYIEVIPAVGVSLIISKLPCGHVG